MIPQMTKASVAAIPPFNELFELESIQADRKESKQSGHETKQSNGNEFFRVFELMGMANRP